MHMFIKVKVYPGSKEERISQLGADRFEARVRELPEQNRANARTKELLAAYFAVPEGKIRLVSGAHKQNKIFEIKM